MTMNIDKTGNNAAALHRFRPTSNGESVTMTEIFHARSALLGHGDRRVQPFAFPLPQPLPPPPHPTDLSSTPRMHSCTHCPGGAGDSLTQTSAVSAEVRGQVLSYARRQHANGRLSSPPAFSRSLRDLLGNNDPPSSSECPTTRLVVAHNPTCLDTY